MPDIASISAAFALTQLLPQLKNIVSTDKAPEVIEKALTTAQEITKTSSTSSMYDKLKSNNDLLILFQEKMMPFLQELDLHKDYRDARFRDIKVRASQGHNRRADIMVGCAALGLIICLGVLGMNRGNLNGEMVGILSMIAGIFGACLKDAFSFEFGAGKPYFVEPPADHKK